jgi:hypothetical protein
MARGSLELGCPQSQGFVDAEHEGHLPNAKRSFRRVHRVHAEGPGPGNAIRMPMTITSHKMDVLPVLLTQLGEIAGLIKAFSSTGVNRSTAAVTASSCASAMGHKSVVFIAAVCAVLLGCCYWSMDQSVAIGHFIQSSLWMLHCSRFIECGGVSSFVQGHM